MPLIRPLFLLCSLTLLPAVTWAQTFPALAPLPGRERSARPRMPQEVLPQEVPGIRRRWRLTLLGRSKWRLGIRVPG